MGWPWRSTFPRSSARSSGERPGTPPLPSFWSDQYGLRVQYVGHARRADAVAIDGDPAPVAVVIDNGPYELILEAAAANDG